MAKRYPKETSQASRAKELEDSSQVADASLRFMGKMQRYIWDIVGVLFLTIGLLTLLALLDLTNGVVISWWAGLLQRWFGLGSYFFIPIALGVGIILIVQRSNTVDKMSWGRILTLEITAFALLALLAIYGDVSLERASQGLDGGLVGWGLAELMGTFVRPGWLLILILSVVILISALIGTGAAAYLGRLAQEFAAVDSENIDPGMAVSIGDEISAEKSPQKKKKAPRLPAEYRKKFKIQVNEEKRGKTSLCGTKGCRIWI